MKKYMKCIWVITLVLIIVFPNKIFAASSSSVYSIKNDKTYVYSIVTIIFCAICVLIAYILLKNHKKNDEVIENIEFYPPKGYNSAEIGFLYEGTASTESITSLLIYLANKGYLKIEETDEDEEILNESKKFKITKIKEYDGKNEYERLFFDGLFKSSGKRVNWDMDKARERMEEATARGEEISFKEAMNGPMQTNAGSSRNSVTPADLESDESFSNASNEIKKRFNSKENNILEPSSNGKETWFAVLIVAIFILITAKPALEYWKNGLTPISVALAFSGLGCIVIINGLIEEDDFIRKCEIIWGLLFGGLPFIFVVLAFFKYNKMYLVMYITGIICMGILMLFSKIMPKRTSFGNEILAKIKEFKKFIKKAKKSQLESLLAQNPEYFYTILPYAFALGVSDDWIDKFETINIQAPNWYESKDTFDFRSLGVFITATMASLYMYGM